MIEKTNLEDRLEDLRNKRVKRTSGLFSGEAILEEVREIFSKNQLEREQIKERLLTSEDTTSRDESKNFNSLDLDRLTSEKIFHISEIKQLCVDYRLRFLDAHFFKGDFPEEAISKIRTLENEHQTTLQGLKIIAPAKLLKLENADDPLLFAPMSNGYYYLIHKWGNDLHPFRKALMWPYKCFENLVFTIFIVSILLTMITPMQAFTNGEVSNQEYLLMFLFMFKAVGGTVLFYGFAKGKNFNSAIWNSRYYNG